MTETGNTTLTQKMIDGFLSCSTEVITVSTGDFSWDIDDKFDVFYVRYQAKKSFKKDKNRIVKFKFKRIRNVEDPSNSNGLSQKTITWKASCLTKDFTNLVNGIINGNNNENLLFDKIKELEDEYLPNNDDFSSGILYAMEEIKKIINSSEKLID